MTSIGTPLFCLLGLLHAQQTVSQGNTACWQGGYTFEFCCDQRLGPDGNPDCWDAAFHSYKSCCLGTGGDAEADYAALIHQGDQGDVSVLPRLLEMLSEPQNCLPPEELPPPLQCQGTPRGLSKAEWKKFFSSHAKSRYMKTEWPSDTHPEKLFERCCTGPNALEVIEEMAGDCCLGTATLLWTNVVAAERDHGQESALRLLSQAQSLRKRCWAMQTFDCHWSQQVNHDHFRQLSWFLGQDTDQFPCGADVKIFVDEDESHAQFRSKPIVCSTRGLSFTEVWLHQYLKRSACRVDDPADADYVYMPIYASCHDLDNPKNSMTEKALASMWEHISTFADMGRKVVLAFTGEKWKLPVPGHLRQKGLTLAVVEARPIIPAPPEASPQDGKNYSIHCKDCFHPERDFVIPSAVTPTDGGRLASFQRATADRDYIAAFRGEHAGTKTRSDVAQGYREVNETIRVAVLNTFQPLPNTSVGGPHMGYSFFMGSSHFCLVPKGRGFWTVRMYEVFYAGCIPVLLSDDYVLPFESWLDWRRFSIKWPSSRVHDGLYEHLRNMVTERYDVVTSMQEEVKKVACWFDYHQPANAACSPYVGFVRELFARKSGEPMRPPPAVTSYWY